MGNGAPVGHQFTSIAADSFDSLEKKCRSGYFSDHSEEYRTLVINSIKNDEIDSLELLIRGGDLISQLPLHIAAKYSSLESIELLLSAGFSPYEIDQRGLTALHKAAGKRGEKSLLCVYALVLGGERALKVKDFKGNTPLHLAIMSNNVEVVDILIRHGASLTVTNSAGHSPRYLAQTLKHHEIVDLIDGKRTGALRSAKKGNGSPPDMERIMAVWERFFENAFKGLELELDDDNDNDGGDEGQKVGWSELRSAEYPTEHIREVMSHTDSQLILDASRSWLSVVLAYNADLIDPSDGEGGEWVGKHDGYFVVDTTAAWSEPWELDDHLYSQQQQFGVWTWPDDGGSETPEDWPYSMRDLIQQGWMPFFDDTCNSCTWMHALSGLVELYLPVGQDETAVTLGLAPYDSNGTQPYWMRPPQLVTRAWVMVQSTTDASDSDGTVDVVFYFNSVTGHSTWQEPVDWEDIIEESNGWVLCAQEHAMEDLFWWHRDTGDVTWYYQEYS